MKAAFTLTPAESKRLIAKAVVQMDELKEALQKAYVIINPGTTCSFVVQELLGKPKPEPQRYAVGVNTHRLLCVTDPGNRDPLPIILFEGKVCFQDNGGSVEGLPARYRGHQGSERH